MNSGDLNLFKIIWESGLVVKLVLASLIISSIFSWAIIIRKFKFFKMVQNSNNEFLNLYRQGSTFAEVHDRAINLSDGPLKTMFFEGHSELRKIREGNKEGNREGSQNFKMYIETFGMDGIDRALKKGGITAKSNLEEGLSILASIGSVTPFVGLFGTVWGIIDSFTGLAKGGGSLEAVAPGIAEALVATAVGLFAAIPAVWFYNHFQNKLASVEADMECFGQEFINTIQRIFLR